MEREEGERMGMLRGWGGGVEGGGWVLLRSTGRRRARVHSNSSSSSSRCNTSNSSNMINSKQRVSGTNGRMA